jgi:hypothetical protein
MRTFAAIFILFIFLSAQTPQGEQGMDLAGSQVEFVDLERVDGGPEVRASLSIPHLATLFYFDSAH